MLFLLSLSINFAGAVSELDEENTNSKPTPANVTDPCQEGTVQHMFICSQNCYQMVGFNISCLCVALHLRYMVIC